MIATEHPGRRFEALDLIIEPAALFARPFEPKRWRYFAALTAICGVISGLLFIPARQHIALLGADAELAHRQVIATYLLPLLEPALMAVGVVLSFVIVLLLRTIVLGRGTAAKYWSIVNEIALVKLGISTLALGIIVSLVGASSYTTPLQISRSMPSLLTLFPAIGGKTAAMLGVIDPFNIWAIFLYSIAFQRLAKQSWSVSVLSGFAVALAPQLIVRYIFG
jgi:hypothetical protein